jgi:LPS-assembly lipoprotein
MWSPDRRAALAALALAAAAGGCGLRPLYGAGGGGVLHRNTVVRVGEGRQAYTFREAMRRRTGDPSADAAFDLAVDVRLEADDLAISERDDITRIDVRGLAAYVLSQRATGAEIERGTARSASGYNTLASPFATRAARLDAERRVVEDLAARVFLNLANALTPPLRT